MLKKKIKHWILKIECWKRMLDVVNWILKTNLEFWKPLSKIENRILNVENECWMLKIECWMLKTNAECWKLILKVVKIEC